MKITHRKLRMPHVYPGMILYAHYLEVVYDGTIYGVQSPQFEYERESKHALAVAKRMMGDKLVELLMQ